MMIQKILENLNITALNPMQQASLEATQKEKDLILLSATGSGKTLGFLLPVLNGLQTEKEGVQALIIVPSRELALQIEQVFRQMGTGFKVNSCYGGHAFKIEKTNLEQPPAVLVGTPGRIADHIKRESFQGASVTSLVLDEFDKALEFGFKEDMAYIIHSLKNLQKRILTSATQALEIPAFTGIKNPVVLNFLSETPGPAKLTLKAVKATGTDKLHTLWRLLCQLENRPTLIICNHREAVERISELLADKDLRHGIFHGGLEQEERQRALVKFRNGTSLRLISTDLISRGIDIPEIEYVIHYQMPPDRNAFVHRNGRTARMESEGTSYLILAEDEEISPYIDKEIALEELEEGNKKPANSEWETLYIAGGKKDKINKMDIVGFLLQYVKLAKEEVGKIEVLDYCCYVAVKKNKADKVVQLGRNQKIKKKSVRIEIAR